MSMSRIIRLVPYLSIMRRLDGYFAIYRVGIAEKLKRVYSLEELNREFKDRTSLYNVEMYMDHIQVFKHFKSRVASGGIGFFY